jgi:hypothetical protein
LFEFCPFFIIFAHRPFQRLSFGMALASCYRTYIEESEPMKPKILIFICVHFKMIDISGSLQ